MTLRTDLFKTRDREDTQVIAVRDTLTRTDDAPSTDAKVLDAAHCKQGRLGIGVHFLVLLNGVIQLCRGVATRGSHSKDIDDISVAVGVVGGADIEGNRSYTRTHQQEEALSDLLGFLGDTYPDAEVNDRPHPG